MSSKSVVLALCAFAFAYQIATFDYHVVRVAAQAVTRSLMIH